MTDLPKVVKNPKQIEATRAISGYFYTMLYGGSRSGKTFIAVYALVVRAWKAPFSRHIIFRKHFNHCKTSVFMDTLPKVIQLMDPVRCKDKSIYAWNKTDYILTLPNSAEIWIGGLDDKERVEKILGHEYATMYYNESSEMSWDAVELTFSRLAQKCEMVDQYGNFAGYLENKFIFDCNPPGKRHWSYRLFIQGVHPVEKTPINNFENTYGSVLMNPDANRANLPQSYFDITLKNMSRRKRDRFEKGLFADDAQGALFSGDDIDNSRFVELPVGLERICVGVDPHVTDPNEAPNPDALDSTGIVSVGRAKATLNGIPGWHYFIISDRTTAKGPLQWAKAVNQCHEDCEADYIAAEVNQGGDLVVLNIRSVNQTLRVKKVRATRGKALRADPVVSLCEQGRLHMVGQFPDLEDEMTGWVPGLSTESPNRLDAMVWAVVSLMVKRDVQIGSPESYK